MKQIKAIETVYNGYKFRSRLEARWAVFFDAAGIRYEYETQGFELEDGTRYLPDFYLPDFDLFVEVKGDRPGAKKDIERCASMIEWGGPIKALMILSDVPGRCTDGGLWHFPVLYYSVKNGGVCSGWFFFYAGDEGEPPYGDISGANYPRPYRFDEDGTILQDGWALPFSLQCVSDQVLRRPFNWTPMIGLREKEKADRHAQELGFKNSLDMMIHFQEGANGFIFDCLEKARQARFEHGEQPVI